MRTLEGLPIAFPTLGWVAADWIEAHCVHGPGDVAGQRIGELDDETVRFLCWAYRLDPETGRRVVSDADLLGPKGWAKSEKAGWIVCFEGFGPARFDGWGATVDEFGFREPVGRPVTSPFIRCLATEESQTGNTYDVVYTCLTEGPLADAYAVDPGLTRTFIKEPGGGEIVPSTSGDVSKDGGKETFAVADETHLYVLPQVKRMYRTVERNLPKRRIAQPWYLRTSTAWEPGQESIAETNWEEFESVDRDVERAVRELGLLVDHREGAEVVLTHDRARREQEDALLRAALLDVYGAAAEWVDVELIIRKHFRRAGADLADAQRYYLNQAVKGSGRWLDPKVVDGLLVDDHLLPGDPVALGFDGSKTTDATALVAIRLTDGLVEPLLLEERPARLPRWGEWEVDVPRVHAAVEAAFRTFRVHLLVADPHWWRDEIDRWHGRWGDKVVRLDTSKTSRIVYSVDRFEKDVASGTLRLSRWPNPADANDRPLRRHLLNAYAEKTRVALETGAPDDPRRFGRVLTKETRDSTDRIDLAMAAVLANEGRGRAISQGAIRPRRRARTAASF